MNVLSGKNVDLLFPFPSSEVKRTFGWNHCYRSLVESEDSPKTPEDFQVYMEQVLGSMPTWGIIDKNHITNIKHEAPLVGIIMFEPMGQGLRDGSLHFATARKAWRTGLMDEAGLMVIEALFEDVPSLQRISGAAVESNFPAKAMYKRLGFKFEGLLEDRVLKEGKLESMVLFGLTRRKRLWQDGSWDPSAGQSVESRGTSLDPQVKAEVSTEPRVELKVEALAEPVEEPQVQLEAQVE